MIVLCFTVQSAFICAEIQFSQKICLVFEARRGRKMTFQKAKPSRILHFCINFFDISRQRKNLFNGRSGSEIGHPKAPWGPHFMLLHCPPGDLIFHLSTFLLLRRFLRHAGALLEGDLSEPSCSPPGGPLGASWGPLRVSLKLHRVLTTEFHLKNLRSFTSWPSCQHLLHFLP